MTPTDVRQRVREVRLMRAGSVDPHPLNWRRHPPAQREALRVLMEEIGFAGALLTRERDDGTLELIDGHLRQSLDPEAVVPVVVTDLTDMEGRQLLGVLDPLAALARPDPERLSALFHRLGGTSDAVVAAIWPESAVGPLMLADWQRPAQPPEPSGRRLIAVTRDQRSVCDAAIAHVRRTMDDYGLSEGACLAAVAQTFLDERA